MGRYQHPLEVHGIQIILDDGLKVKDIETKDLLLMILIELKIMNNHLYSMTDEEISDEGGD